MIQEMKQPVKTHNQVTTLSGVIEKLQAKKIRNEFHWSPLGFTAGQGKIYHPDDLKVITTYRFHDESEPLDSSILYVLKAKDGLIGYLVFTIITKMKKVSTKSLGKYLLKRK